MALEAQCVLEYENPILYLFLQKLSLAKWSTAIREGTGSVTGWREGPSSARPGIWSLCEQSLDAIMAHASFRESLHEGLLSAIGFLGQAKRKLRPRLISHYGLLFTPIMRLVAVCDLQETAFALRRFQRPAKADFDCADEQADAFSNDSFVFLNDSERFNTSRQGRKAESRPLRNAKMLFTVLTESIGPTQRILRRCIRLTSAISLIGRSSTILPV